MSRHNPSYIESLEGRRLLAVSLVKDINDLPGGPASDKMYGVGNIAYFAQDDGVHGIEPWRTDGTSAGTYLLKDCNPGARWSFAQRFIAVGSTVYFSAYTEATGYELWKTDGTEAGTVMVKDINPGPGGSTSLETAATDGTTLFFHANDGATGNELWRSNGTAAGTTPAGDLRPGTSGLAMQRIAVMNGYAYFAGHNGTSSGLYRVNSTGTIELVKAVSSSSSSTDPFNSIYSPVATTNRVYFSDALGYVYATTGTTASTIRIDSVNKAPAEMTAVGSTIYYTKYSSLYRVTSLALSPTVFNGDLTSSSFRSPTQLTNVNGTLYLTGTTSSTGMVIFYLPTSSSSPTLFANPLSALGLGGSIFALCAAGNALYLPIYDSHTQTGTQVTLVKVDLTTAGATNLGQLLNSPMQDAGSNAVGFAAAGTTLVFFNSTPTTGVEPWRSAGTAGTTGLIRDISPDTRDSFAVSLGSVGNVVLLRAETTTYGSEVWRTDGTAAGTQLLFDVYPGSFSSSPQYLTTIGNQLYFTATDATSGEELWVTDGTTVGTHRVKDVNPGTSDSGINTMIGLNGVGYFFATTAAQGTELWRTDGTDAGTHLVKDIVSGSGSGGDDAFYPSLAAMNGKVYFVSGSSADGGAELWQTDGTAAGTAQVADIAPGSSGAVPGDFLVAGSWLYFAATGAAGRELYRTDGTAANTVRVADVIAGASGSNPDLLTAIGDTLYFSANDGTNGTELWRTSVATTATSIVSDLSTGSASTSFRAWTAFKGKLFFGATRGDQTQALFSTDGTAAGTSAVKEFGASFYGVSGASLLNTGGRLLMFADDNVLSLEPWESDGTTAGTHLLSDIGPGSLQSQATRAIELPNGMGVVFSATDYVHGIEPFIATDDVAPSLYNTRYEADQEEIVLPVTENVSASLATATFTLTNLTTNSVVPNAQLVVSSDASSNTIRIRRASGHFADANYRLNIAANQLADRAGNRLATATTLDFFVLAGDFNRDRFVNFDDLLILAQNYGQAGRTFSQGNINYSADGLVNFDDLLLFAQRYGSSLLGASADVSAKRRGSTAADVIR